MTTFKQYYSEWKLRNKVFFIVITSFIIVTSLIGSLGLYNFFVLNYQQDPDIILSVGGFSAFFDNLQNSIGSNYKDYFKPITDNITKGCIDDKCKFDKIFSYLDPCEHCTFQYEDSTDINPINTWNSKKGDCDTLSNLFHFMLLSQNIDSNLACSGNHCWLTMKIDNKKIIADIVNGYYEEIN